MGPARLGEAVITSVEITAMPSLRFTATSAAWSRGHLGAPIDQGPGTSPRPRCLVQVANFAQRPASVQTPYLTSHQSRSERCRDTIGLDNS